MALEITSENQLYKQIRAGDIKPCYLFYGKDVATLEQVVHKLTAKLVPADARDLNYHYFTSDELSLSELGDIAASLPVFADRIVVALNDINAENMRADDLKYLKSIIADVDPETVTLIIYATGTDLCAGKKSLSKKNLALAEHVVKSGGTVVEFAYKKPYELVKYIQGQVEKRGARIAPDAAKTLAELCLCNLLMINNEIEKLCAYRFKGDITADDVTLLASGQTDTDAYKLAKAVASGDTKAVFTILPELYSRQQESVQLLSVVGGAFLDLYRAKLALISGRGESDISSDFDYKRREFAIKNALRDCSRIPVERLRYCLRVMSDCDIDMKSKRTDQRILFETAITRMLSE